MTLGAAILNGLEKAGSDFEIAKRPSQGRTNPLPDFAMALYDG